MQDISEKSLIKFIIAMKEFKERLELFAKQQYDMGQTRFEDYCKLSHGTISAIKASGPSASVVTRIAVTCPELNLNWLFRGKGSMLLKDDLDSQQSGSAMEISVVKSAGAVIISDASRLESLIQGAVLKAINNK